MEIICVSKFGHDGDITEGKIYDAELENVESISYCYSLVNDSGDRLWYNHGHFITLDEYREKVLEEIFNK